MANNEVTVEMSLQAFLKIVNTFAFCEGQLSGVAQTLRNKSVETKLALMQERLSELGTVLINVAEKKGR